MLENAITGRSYRSLGILGACLAGALAKAGHFLLFPPYPATLEAPLKVGLRAMPALEVLLSVPPRDRTTQEERESVPAVLPRVTDRAFSLMRRPARRGR